MPHAGDSFIVELSDTHLDWGNYRHTHSRNRIVGEAYIPIPSEYARMFKIYNSNYGSSGLGVNEFNAWTVSGDYLGVVKTSGSKKAGDVYAKNLHGSGDLKSLGNWFYRVSMRPGDKVKVKWTTPKDIILEKL